MVMGRYGKFGNSKEGDRVLDTIDLGVADICDLYLLIRINYLTTYLM